MTDIALPDDGASLRANTRLKLPDCCVVLAAQQSAGAILTFDRRLAAVVRQLGIAVQEPV